MAAADIAQRVDVQGARGPMSASGERRTLAAVAAEGSPALMERQLAVLAAAGEADLFRDNATQLLVDGPATFQAMKTAIAAARERVLLESYIFEDSGIAADIGGLLVQKAAQGVGVAVLYDSIGSISSDAAFFEQLKAGGVNVCAFNPVNPLQSRAGANWEPTHRDHRKLLVVDNDSAFTGGINISSVYSSGSSLRRRTSASDDEALKDGWRDTQIQLRGPVVAAFGATFEQSWQRQQCPAVPAVPAASATPAAAGKRVVKLMATDPAGPSHVYRTLLASIDAARSSIHLTMAYFAPGDDMVQALIDAARRGIDVQLLLPGKSDSTLVQRAGQSYYAPLLDAGVRIHEMRHAVLHAKSAVIDGVLSTVGSSNFDWRSFTGNDEINVLVLGDDFGGEMEALFQRDVNASVPITADDWRQRGLGQRMLERLGRLMERWL